ncbi:AraC family transcriptional regulator, partial [Pseudomonas putida]
MDVTERTSAHGLEAYIRGERLAASDVLADRDMLVQIFNREREEDSFIVPAVAEPLLVWIISGNAFVQERELGGEWQCSRVANGDFFLTTSAQPYEMCWKVDGAEPFEVMHIYLGIPLLEKAIQEVLGSSVEAVRLREVSGGRDDGLSVLLEQVRLELTGQRASPLYLQGLAQCIAIHLA